MAEKSYIHSADRSERGFALVAFAIILPIFVLFIFMSFQLGKQTADLSILPMRLDSLFSSGISLSYQLTESGYKPSELINADTSLQGALDRLEDYVGVTTFRATAAAWDVECASATVPTKLGEAYREVGLPGAPDLTGMPEMCRSQVDKLTAGQCPTGSSAVCVTASLIIPTALGEKTFAVAHTYRQGSS